jgi:hypothetical protein
MPGDAAAEYEDEEEDLLEVRKGVNLGVKSAVKQGLS